MQRVPIEEVKRQAMTCLKCRLAENRTTVVWADGNPKADLVLIGEGPGFHEDKQGVPFVGAAGKILNTLLAQIGCTREQVLIANTIKCRPPGNRDPMPDEIDSCRPYLEAQLAHAEPKVIITLGNFATRWVLGKAVSISRVRGQKFEAFEAVVVPTYHPAAVLHSGGPGGRMMGELEEDFATAAALLADEAPRRDQALQQALQQALF